MNGGGKGKSVFVLIFVCGVGIAIGALPWRNLWEPLAHFYKDKSTQAEKPEISDHEGHDDEGTIVLSLEQRKTLGLKMATVGAEAIDETLAVTGKIAAHPDKTVVVSPRTAGRLVRVMAELGNTVRAGESLAFLDSMEAAEVLAEVSQSEAALNLALARAQKEREIYEAKLRVLETAGRQGSAAEAEAALARVELGRPKQEYLAALARLELARATYERQQLLVEKRIGARKDLIEAEKTLIMARGEVDAVGETIRITARQELLAAETATQQVRLQRDKLLEKLRLLGMNKAPGAEKTGLLPLTAPFAGTVIERQAVEGQLVEPGFCAFRLADLGTVLAVMDVPETVMARLRVGQEVVLEQVGEAAEGQTGRIKLIGDIVDEQTRTVKVRVELLNTNHRLRPGMFVTARITVGRGAFQQVTLPASAVLLIEDQWIAFVEEGKGFKVRPVELGAKTGGKIVIRKGLNPGEKVVVDGAFALKAQIMKSKLGENESGSGHVH